MQREWLGRVLQVQQEKAGQSMWHHLATRQAVFR